MINTQSLIKCSHFINRIQGRVVTLCGPRVDQEEAPTLTVNFILYDA